MITKLLSNLYHLFIILSTISITWDGEEIRIVSPFTITIKSDGDFKLNSLTIYLNCTNTTKPTKESNLIVKEDVYVSSR